MSTNVTDTADGINAVDTINAATATNGKIIEDGQVAGAVDAVAATKAATKAEPATPTKSGGVAWSDKEQTRFILLAMNQLLESSKQVLDLKKMSEAMPGRTPKALGHKWGGIKLDLAALKKELEANVSTTPPAGKKKAEGAADAPPRAKKPRFKKLVASKLSEEVVDDSKEEPADEV